MTIKSKYKYIAFLLFASILFSIQATAQTRVKGIVTDSTTKEVISFVSVYLKGTPDGMNTNERGEFSISSSISTAKELVVACLGYEKKTIPIKPGKLNVINIKLVPSFIELPEVVIKEKVDDYSRKNNPAVDFVKKVIATRDENDPKNHPNYKYEEYEKMTIAFNNFTEEKLEKGMFSRFKFMKEYIDTSYISGKPILNISIREQLSNYFYQKSPKTEKRVVDGIRRSGMDEVFSQEGLQVFLDEVFKEVDLFQNDIPLFLNRFTSPLSSMGPTFYKYFLEDTVYIDGEKCMNLAFTPFNMESFGFVGNLYITLDSTNFVKRVSLKIPQSINLNFVQNMTIEQDYKRMPDGTRLITHDDVIVEFQIVPNSDGLYARRSVSYKNHSFEKPEDEKLFSMSEKVLEEDNARLKNEDFWKERRHEPIKQKEDGVTSLMKRLRDNPIYYYTEKVIGVLVSGYIPTKNEGSMFDFGPMNTTISGNSLEGVRLRLGGTTTAYLNKKLFASGYVAYGTKDEKFKYNAQLEYSFRKKKEHSNEFPIHSIKARYNYDINQLGQQYIFTNKDNMFLAIKRKDDILSTYIRKAEFSYNREHYSGFSYGLTLRHSIETATKYLPFISLSNGVATQLDQYSMGVAEIKLRYAPNEKFYQMKSERIPVTLDAPIFTLTHTTGQKGLLGSDYTYNLTTLGFQKQFWLSFLGYAKVKVRAGKVWNKVPFPMLTLPNANLSYTIQSESFAMMNALEFINDQYASLSVAYHANGFLFNRIPLLKWLKWREVLSFHGIYGSLSDKNNPLYSNDGIFQFPATSYTMGSKPYMEAGVGIENIFKVLRMDYIWRLNYLDHPNISKSGVRICLEFTF